MSFIIRLQNLPITANSLDIRRFFSGLLILDGGVHIVGGPDKIAFIMFTTDEEARQAMEKQHQGLIKDSKIQLYLSSNKEMKQVIDKARNQNIDKTKLISSTVTTNNNSQTHQQQQSTSSSLGNGSKQIRTHNNNNLTTNLSSIKKADKLSPLATAQFNFNHNNNLNNGSNNAIANLISNLQETPDYRRHKSRSPPIDRQLNDRLLDEQLNSNAYNNHRFKQMLDQVKNLDNSNHNLSPNSNVGSTVRSRLGGFDLPLASDLELNSRWTSSHLNGTPQQQTSSSSAALLMTPQTLHDANASFYDNQITLSNHLSNSILLSNQQQNANRFIVELKGLPINVQVIDIQSFFRPIGILLNRDQIKLSLDERGQFQEHGVAHIILFNEADFQSSLHLNGRYIGPNRIEVVAIIENNGGTLLNSPLTSSAKNFELLNQMNYISTNQLSPNFSSSTVIIDNNLVGRDSYVRRAKLYPIFMKGIPYSSCNQQEVAKFFEPIQLFKIIIQQERNGRASGNAYIILDSRENFDLAMKRNNNYMGPRYIELFAVRMEEVERYMEILQNRSNGLDSQDDDLNDLNSNEFNNRKRRRSLDRLPLDNQNNNCMDAIYAVQVKGLPPLANNTDLTNYFMDFGAQASAVHIMLKADGGNAGECFCEFKDKISLENALKQNGARMGSYILSIRKISYSKVCHIVGLKPQSSKIAKHIDNRYSFNSSSDKEPNRIERRSSIFAKVSLQASKSDICQFFQDYDLTPDRIVYKLDRNGTKSDEILIQFKNPKEADRVIRNMNHKFFMGSKIYLRHA